MLNPLHTAHTSRRRRLPFLLPLAIAIASAGVGIAAFSGSHESPTGAVRPTPLPPPLHPTAPDYDYADLPGMNLEVPVLDGARPTLVGDDGNGRLIHTSPGETWVVAWHTGPAPDRESRRGDVEAVLRHKQLLPTNHHVPPPHDLSLGGSSGYEIDGDVPGGSYVVAVGTCAGRSVEITAAGAILITPARLEHMVETFHCTADPWQAPEPVTTVSVDVVPGWSRIAPGTETLRDDANGTELRFELWELPPTVSADDRVRSRFNVSAMNLTSQLPDPLGNDHQLWRARNATDPPSKRPFAVVTWPCPSGKHVGVIRIFSAHDLETEIEAGIALARSGRCVAPGETVSAFPIRRQQ